MASTLKWTAYGTFNSMFGSSDLNSLANGSTAITSLSAPVVDTTSSLELWGVAEFTGGSISPVPPADVIFFLIPLLSDGSTYMDGEAGATAVNQPIWLSMPHCSIPLRGKGSSTQAARARRFMIEPGKYKPALLNRAGVALASSGNMVKLALFSEQAA